MSFSAATKWTVNCLDVVARFFIRFGINADFIRFGIIGGFGFVWDTATVYALRGLVGIYVAGACAFLVAGTANWALNRLWTFRHLDHIAAHRQLIRFLLANSVGFTFNRGTFFALVSVSPLCHAQPVFAVMAGTAAGLCFNYFLSRKFVFT
jgi:putative flippase GtrA